jgi:hypothetical protein
VSRQDVPPQADPLLNNTAPPALYTEVWSPIFDNTTGTFSVGDLGAISPTGTEGDAIQLWSYGFLAAVDPRNGTVVASGTV